MANYLIHPLQFLDLKLLSTGHYVALSWVGFFITLSFLLVTQMHIHYELHVSSVLKQKSYMQSKWDFILWQAQLT